MESDTGVLEGTEPLLPCRLSLFSYISISPIIIIFCILHIRDQMIYYISYNITKQIISSLTIFIQKATELSLTLRHHIVLVKASVVFQLVQRLLLPW